MKNWYMLTLVGRDTSGIVAEVTQTLYQHDCNLGEASMLRLGGNFTIMLMVEAAQSRDELHAFILPYAEKNNFQLHVDQIEGRLHQHKESDVHVSVHGADRAGIVAQVTTNLMEAGLNILDLRSDVAGTEYAPIYVMTFSGQASQGVEALQNAVNELQKNDIEVQLQTEDILFG